jgi:hypothetical protein
MTTTPSRSWVSRRRSLKADASIRPSTVKNATAALTLVQPSTVTESTEAPVRPDTDASALANNSRAAGVRYSVIDSSTPAANRGPNAASPNNSSGTSETNV